MRAYEKLRVVWGKRERDLVFHFPLGPQTKSDGHLLHVCLNTNPPRSWLDDRDAPITPSLVEELKARGYDITTLRFSIEKDPSHPRWQK